jgi:hypothetical protein
MDGVRGPGWEFLLFSTNHLTIFPTQAALLAVLHDEPSPVFDFLLADTSQGFWVRTTLETTKDNRIVLWRVRSIEQVIVFIPEI